MTAFNDQIDAILNEFSGATTSEELETALGKYDTRDLLAVVATRALAAASGSGGGSRPIERADVLVTSAQLLTQHERRDIVVPAPGAGKALIPLSLVTAVEFADAPYSLAHLDGGPATGNEPSLGWDTVGDQSFEAGAFKEILSLTSNQVRYQATFPDFEGYEYPLVGDYGIEDVAIILYFSTPDLKLLGGGGDLRFSLFYAVVNVAA